MKKRERKLRAAIGGQARAKEAARRRAAEAQAKAKKYRMRAKKLRATVAKHERKIVALAREIKINELRAMHVLNAWKKKALKVDDQLADLRLKHIEHVGRERIRRARLTGRAR